MIVKVMGSRSMVGKEIKSKEFNSKTEHEKELWLENHNKDKQNILLA